VNRSRECYRAGTGNDYDFDDIGDEVEKAVVDIYTSGKFECNEDDLKEIPEVLESLNVQWQELTKQGDLFSERFKKKIVRDAVKGPGQVARAEALPQPSRPQQQRSRAKAPPQGAAEGIGSGDDEVAAAAGRAGGSRSGGGGDDGAGDGRVGADAGPGRVAQGAPASQMQQPPQPRAAAAGGEGGSRGCGEGHVGADARQANLPAREGQGHFPAIHEGGKGKGKEKAADGDGEEQEEEVADSEEEGVQKSRSMRKHVAGASGSGKSKRSVVRPRLCILQRGRAQGSKAAAATLWDKGKRKRQRGEEGRRREKRGEEEPQQDDVKKIKKQFMQDVNANEHKCHIQGCNHDFSSHPDQRRNAIITNHLKFCHSDLLKPRGTGVCVFIYICMYAYTHVVIYNIYVIYISAKSLSHFRSNFF
jgi:hypothetical protein